MFRIRSSDTAPAGIGSYAFRSVVLPIAGAPNFRLLPGKAMAQALFGWQAERAWPMARPIRLGFPRTSHLAPRTWYPVDLRSSPRMRYSFFEYCQTP